MELARLAMMPNDTTIVASDSFVKRFVRRVLDAIAWRIALRLRVEPAPAAPPPEKLDIDAVAERLAQRLQQPAPVPVPAPPVLPAPGPMVLHVDYPVHPRTRFGAAWGEPVHEKLQAVLRSQDAELRATLAMIASYSDDLQRIPPTAAEEENTPRWINGWLPGLDGAAIYAFLRDRKPATYWEVGSGNSTRFARRAIEDGKLATRIVSIDPAPRAEIDALCDEVIRKPLEDAAAELIARVAPGDVCFIDCSHRAFQNSDVTVAMLEVLPALPAGVVVGFHDIFLPDDYPPTWLERYYNEQYLLAMFLLGGHAGTDIVLPSWDASRREEMAGIVAPIWGAERFNEVERHGDAFWLRVRRGG